MKPKLKYQHQESEENFPKVETNIVIDILKSIYKGIPVRYQTRKPEIEHHEPTMEFRLTKNDECSGSGMPYRTR
jgi:hypothetical protein